MRRSALIVSLLSLTSFLSASADDVSPPISMLKIVLEPSGETEIAPHQQGNVYAPDVIREGKNLRMWYGGQGRDGHDRIATAVSQDGLNWVRQGIAIQNERANHVNDPSVVVVNGKYYMYYTRTEKDVVDRIDLAISDDGTHWTTRGAVIVPENPTDWDGLSVGRPSVIFDGQQFHLWYDGRKDFPPNAPVKDVPKSPSSHRSVGYATSADGMTWILSLIHI